MAELDVPDYAWVSDPSRCQVAMAACITVATGVSPEGALLALGADPDGATLAWTDEVETEDPTVAVVAADGAVVAVEYNGWQGSRREVLRPLSRGGPGARTGT